MSDKDASVFVPREDVMFGIVGFKPRLWTTGCECVRCGAVIDAVGPDPREAIRSALIFHLEEKHGAPARPVGRAS